jgi:glycosyltransferase involved in cell wall biosynthesis
MLPSSFSVVIPTFNRRDLLERALQSVWAQTAPPAQVIVVDDGSTDGTADYLRSIDRPIVALRTAQAGPGAARNAGALVADADYIAFLDSDDLWFPWTLTAMGEAIVRHHRPAYICGSCMQFTDERELAAVPAADLQSEGFPHYFSTWPRQFVIGAGMIAVRRDVFTESGGFAPAPVNMEDHDLSLRLGLSPGFVQIVAPTTIAWRQHGAGVTRELNRSSEGCHLLLEGERNGRYPGGQRWTGVRRNLITTHTRSFSLECLKSGRTNDAWRIYRQTLAWHLRLCRLRYLVAFPLLAWTRSIRRLAA